MRGLGGYTLGDRYTTPDRRLSQMLMRQGSRGGASDSWQETLGRIAQQLSGAYIGKLDQDKQDLANQTLAKVQPDEHTMQPTMNDQQIMESEGVQNILRQKTDADRMGNPMIQRNITAIRNEQDRIADQEQSLSDLQDTASRNRFTDGGELMQVQGPLTDKYYSGQIDRATQNIENYGDEFNQTMGRLRSQEPTDDQRAEAVRREILRQRRASEVNTLNEKMPQIDYALQNLLALKDNSYAQRLAQGLMMNKMSNDAASRLAQTAREQQLADDARDRGYTVEDRDLLAQNKIDVKAVGEETGPFRGTSMEAQDSNMLINGDPSSAAYRSSYARMAQPKTTFDPVSNQMISINPDMSGYRLPTGSVAGQRVQTQTPQQPPGQPSVSVTEGRGRTKPYPEFQSKSAGFYNRMMDANKEIDNIFSGPDGKQGTSDDLKSEDVYNWKEFGLSKIPGGNVMNSDEFQRVQQAQANWVTANLRLESGAAIPPEEQAAEFRKYFPVFGDSDAVIAQKARARKQVEKNMVTQSQGAYESMYGSSTLSPDKKKRLDELRRKARGQ